MHSTLVTVAAYRDVAVATADWEAFELRGLSGQVDVIDSVLLDTADGTVRSLLRATALSEAHGAVAGAIVALLRPAALVCGALAGGVGEAMLTSLSRGLTRVDVRRLGEVLDEGRLAIVTAETRDARCRSGTIVTWPAATAVASAPADVSEDDIMWAMLHDSVVDR